MKKLLLALAALIVMIGIYLALRPEPRARPESPYALEAIPDLARVELTPAGAAAPIVLEKSGDDWLVAGPPPGPLEEGVAGALGALFKEPIAADDLPLSPEKAADYEVDMASATRARLFAAGSEEPAADLYIGKTIEAPETRAERTFVRPADSDQIWRLRAGLKRLRAGDRAALRSRVATALGEEEVSTIAIERSGEPAYAIERENDQWKVRGAPEERVAQQTAGAIAQALRSLKASEVLEEPPEGVSFEEPAFVVRAAEITIEGASDTGEDEEGASYLRVKGSPLVYKIDAYTRSRLAPKRSALRDRVVRPLDRDEIVAVRYAGERGVRLERGEEGAWRMTRPEKLEELDEVQLDAAITFLSSIRAATYVEPDRAEQGLGRGADRVVITMADGTKHELLLGAKRPLDEPGKDYERYAMFADDPQTVFTIPKYTARRFEPSVDELRPKP